MYGLDVLTSNSVQMLKEVENHFKGCTKHLNELRVSHLVVYFRNELANFGVKESFSLGKDLSLHEEMSGLTFAPSQSTEKAL